VANRSTKPSHYYVTNCVRYVSLSLSLSFPFGQLPSASSPIIREEGSSRSENSPTGKRKRPIEDEERGREREGKKEKVSEKDEPEMVGEDVVTRERVKESKMNRPGVRERQSEWRKEMRKEGREGGK